MTSLLEGQDEFYFLGKFVIEQFLFVLFFLLEWQHSILNTRSFCYRSSFASESEDVFFSTRNKRNKVNKDTTDSKNHLKIGPNCPKEGKIIVFLSICRNMVQANEQLDGGVKYLVS